MYGMELGVVLDEGNWERTSRGSGCKLRIDAGKD